jgi:hypothetical protein
VRTKCAKKTCVGMWGYSWGPRELSGVGRPGLGEAGRYKGRSLKLTLVIRPDGVPCGGVPLSLGNSSSDP